MFSALLLALATSNCTAVTLTCDTPYLGTYGPNSCLDTDGGDTDRYQLFGRAGDEITIVLEGLDSSFDNAYIELIPPPGDDAITPLVIGNQSASLKYVLTSTGNWEIRVAGGPSDKETHYRVRVLCRPVTYSGNCEPQPAACGQEWDWSLTPASCRLKGRGDAYAPFAIHLDVGDKIALDVNSSDFYPGVLLWHVNANGNPSGDPVAVAEDEDEIGSVYLQYRVKTSGPYEIGVYNINADGYGAFSLDIGCHTTCTTPVILTHPRSQTTNGGPVTLSVETFGEGPFAYQWYQGAKGDESHHIPSRLPTLTLPSVPATTSYWVLVTNECGTVQSNAAVVNVVPPGKHHIAGHED